MQMQVKFRSKVSQVVCQTSSILSCFLRVWSTLTLGLKLQVSWLDSDKEYSTILEDNARGDRLCHEWHAWENYHFKILLWNKCRETHLLLYFGDTMHSIQEDPLLVKNLCRIKVRKRANTETLRQLLFGDQRRRPASLVSSFSLLSLVLALP